MIVVGLKLKDFPTTKNKVTFAIELMNKLGDKMPSDMDIFIT